MYRGYRDAFPSRNMRHEGQNQGRCYDPYHSRYNPTPYHQVEHQSAQRQQECPLPKVNQGLPLPVPQEPWEEQARLRISDWDPLDVIPIQVVIKTHNIPRSESGNQATWVQGLADQLPGM